MKDVTDIVGRRITGSIADGMYVYEVTNETHGMWVRLEFIDDNGYNYPSPIIEAYHRWMLIKVARSLVDYR